MAAMDPEQWQVIFQGRSPVHLVLIQLPETVTDPEVIRPLFRILIPAVRLNLMPAPFENPGFFGLFYTVHDCHAWVCDGYTSVKNNCFFSLKLHMNWGWDGYYDGWYAYNHWNPGNINFQYAQDITHNIAL